MTVVGRPPVLRCCHHLLDIVLDSSQIKRVECCRIVEVGVHGIRQRGMLAQNAQLELIGPPITVAGAAARGLGVGLTGERAGYCSIRPVLMIVFHDGICGKVKEWSSTSGANACEYTKQTQPRL